MAILCINRLQISILSEKVYLNPVFFASAGFRAVAVLFTSKLNKFLT